MKDRLQNFYRNLCIFRAVTVRSQQEKARYAEELSETCKEIEEYEIGKRQTLALRQWENISDRERSRILIPVSEGVEKMTALAQQKGCKAMGEYLEVSVMEEVLMILDLPKK